MSLPKRSAGASLECFGRDIHASPLHTLRRTEKASTRRASFGPSPALRRQPCSVPYLSLGRFDRRRLGPEDGAGRALGKAASVPLPKHSSAAPAARFGEEYR